MFYKEGEGDEERAALLDERARQGLTDKVTWEQMKRRTTLIAGEEIETEGTASAKAPMQGSAEHYLGMPRRLR